MNLRRLTLSALLVATVLAGPRAAEAILIQLVYDPGSHGIDACNTLVIKDTDQGPVLDHRLTVKQLQDGIKSFCR